MKFGNPWDKYYTDVMENPIDWERYANMSVLLDEVIAKYSKKTAFSFMGEGVSYGKLDELACDIAAYMNTIGIKERDKVAIMMPNCLQYPVIVLACIKIGAVIVNTNPLYTPREMKHQFNDAEVTNIFIAENYCSNLAVILQETGIKNIITTGLGDLLGLFKGKFVNFAIKYIKKLVPKYDLASSTQFLKAIEKGHGKCYQPTTAIHDDVLCLQYTGGTTGVSKGAMLTHKNIIANILQCRNVFKMFVKEEEDFTFLCPLPMYHIFAFTCNLVMMTFESNTVLIANPRDLSSIITVFRKYTISGLIGVNTLYNAMLSNKEFGNCDFKSLRFAFAGGMALNSNVFLKWTEVTGSQIYEGYGLSETSPVLTANHYHLNQQGTIGFPMVDTEIRLTDEQGNEVACGQVGELEAKGPQIMMGYYNSPIETEKAISSDGWFKTGDLGLMTEDGIFKIVDRKKDMILVSGFNVYPNEIEDVVMQNEKVKEVAAVGVPHAKSGEVVKLFVVKRDDTLDEAELQTYCHKNLTGYKCPKEIEFVDDLPKTNVGKILRRALRK